MKLSNDKNTFFSNYDTFRIIVRQIVPSGVWENKVNVWVAGCSMGHLTYSLAILLAERVGPFASKHFSIYATDLDENNFYKEIITRGIYPRKELQLIPKKLFSKYFKGVVQQGYYQVIHYIRNRINFHKLDLLSLNPVYSRFSLIVCTDMLETYSQKQQLNVITMFHKVLLPGGYLLLNMSGQFPEQCLNKFKSVNQAGTLYQKILDRKDVKSFRLYSTVNEPKVQSTRKSFRLDHPTKKKQDDAG